mmetsp:Transcript_7372/g.29621  ORF Transcript_7372/g.29621 Transcript_7372/m.29621 type:complete len:211 (-) Transcript_7372:259-891(-)
MGSAPHAMRHRVNTGPALAVARHSRNAASLILMLESFFFSTSKALGSTASVTNDVSISLLNILAAVTHSNATVRILADADSFSKTLTKTPHARVVKSVSFATNTLVAVSIARTNSAPACSASSIAATSLVDVPNASFKRSTIEMSDLLKSICAFVTPESLFIKFPKSLFTQFSKSICELERSLAAIRGDELAAAAAAAAATSPFTPTFAI